MSFRCSHGKKTVLQEMRSIAGAPPRLRIEQVLVRVHNHVAHADEVARQEVRAPLFPAAEGP